MHSIAHAGALVPIGGSRLLIENRRRAASVLVSLGLITACALLVHIWHGAIEAHFLFFVTIVVLALYEDWIAVPGRGGLRRDPPRLHGGAPSGRRLQPPGRDRPPVEVGVDPRRLRRRGGHGERHRVAPERDRQGRGGGVLPPRARERGALQGRLRGRPDRHGPVQLRPRRREVIQVNRRCATSPATRASTCGRTTCRTSCTPTTRTTHDAVERLLTGGEEQHPQFELRYVHADGHTVWVSVSVSLLRAESGKPGSRSPRSRTSPSASASRRS